MHDRLRITLPAATGGRPVIDLRLAEELAAVIEATTARYVTLEGPPGDFCEGLDLEALSRPTGVAEPTLRGYATLLRAVQEAPCPVVALVDGVALGGGLGLVAAADLVLATPRSTFGLPEVVAGLGPAVALPYVAQRTGLARARLLALDGGSVNAARAMKAGLVDEVVPDLEAALAAHAGRLLRTDRNAQRHLKGIAAALRTPGSEADARRRFLALHHTDSTRTRIARLAAGDAPWLTDDGSGHDRADRFDHEKAHEETPGEAR
ncbi:MAG: enoyl-CoA hydratase-related protein [Thermocrispum sp.]